MSSWKDVHKGGENGSELRMIEKLHENFADCRILLQAITGYIPGEKDTLPRVKVTLFYEMGVVKLCVCDDTKERLGFVTLDPDNATMAEALNEALLGGIDWRKKPKPTQGAWQGRR